MKKIPLLSVLLIIAVVFIAAQRFLALNNNSLPKNQINVLVVYNPTLSKNHPGIIAAYDRVLEEEGVPHKVVTSYSILTRNFEELLKPNPVIIIPDIVAQSLPADLAQWLKNYLYNGGSVMIVYDGGTKDKKGAYLEKALFSDFVGVNYITYAHQKGKAYTKGFIKFKDSASANLFQVPGGTLTTDNIISGYRYGKLEFPVARLDSPVNLAENEIYAYALTEDNERYPALILKKHGAGNLLYVNLPLGYLKAYASDLPLRVILRTFLFKVVKIPHLVNTPSGKGGLVINWHIDANPDWKSIPFMEKENLFRKNIPCSIHVTAGDFRDKPGDGFGFDAGGKGRPYLEELAKYGTIGSHGGWAHNWFAKNLDEGRMKPEEEEKYIKKNSDCLQDIVKYKITEYSAPAGVHPQPATTEILEKLGFTAYYYTGDSGSAPNRTFVNGKMVSGKVIAFPVMPYGKEASLREMKISDVSSQDAQKWLCNTLDYTVQNRTVRLIYSHPYNVPDYLKAFKLFLNYAEKIQNEGKARIKPMSYFAQFLLRFLKTEYTFKNLGDKLAINLKNVDGLNEITLAIPKDRYQKPQNSEFLLDEDGDYYYLTYNGSLCEQTLSFNNR